MASKKVIASLIRNWEWDERKHKAAALIAAGQFTSGTPSTVAAAVGVSRETIQDWRQIPAFTARVDEIIAACRSHASGITIAQAVSRIQGMDGDVKAIEATELAIRESVLARRAELPGLIAAARAELMAWQLDLIVERIEALSDVNVDQDLVDEYKSLCARRDWIQVNPRAYEIKLRRLEQDVYRLENDPANLAGVENANYAVDIEDDRGRITIKRKWDLAAVAQKTALRVTVARELGQNEPDKVDMTSKGSAIAFGALTDADIDRRIQELEERKASPAV